jgi:hypothetical protein
MNDPYILSILVYDQVASATLSASPSAVAKLPESGLQDPLRSRIMRSTGTAQQVTVDFATASTVRHVMLCRHNITDSATVTVKFYNGATLQETATADVRPRCVMAIAAQERTSTRLVIDLSDAGNTDGYLDIGRLVAGVMWQPNINYKWGAVRRVVSADTRNRSKFGSLYQIKRIRYDSYEMKFEHLDSASGDVLRGLDPTQDYFMSPYFGWGDSNESDMEGMYHPRDFLEMPHDGHLRFSTTLTVEEA